MQDVLIRRLQTDIDIKEDSDVFGCQIFVYLSDISLKCSMSLLLEICRIMICRRNICHLEMKTFFTKFSNICENKSVGNGFV